MSTVVNNPNNPYRTDNSGTNIMLGLVLVLLTLGMLWYFGMPYFNNLAQNTVPAENTQINVQEQPQPLQNNDESLFVVPEDIDVTIDGDMTTENQ